MKTDKENTFRKELQNLINCHSMENQSKTPDFILAEYLTSCLAAFDHAVNLRTRFAPQPEKLPRVVLPLIPNGD